MARKNEERLGLAKAAKLYLLKGDGEGSREQGNSQCLVCEC